MSKKSLFDGCSRSRISVTPKNWKTQKASISRPWRINYRFYDPAFKGTKNWGKPVKILGMNDYKTLQERQDITRGLIANEENLVDVQGYNPITGMFMAPPEPEPPATESTVEEITPDTSFIPALRLACKFLTCVKEMRSDVNSAINGLERSADKMYDKLLQKQYTDLPIRLISRRHLVYILKQCEVDNPRFSDDRYNKYRAYLMLLFKEIVRVEACGANPATDLAMRKKVKKKRVMPEEDEQVLIDTSIKARDYNYWRYMRIFLRSGSRSSELLGLVKDRTISLVKQEFTIMVKKDNEIREDTRPIPDDILPLWREMLAEAQPGEYLFSVGFKPGPRRIGRDNVDKRWKKYVKWPPEKGGLGLPIDFYTLKSYNADNIDEQLDLNHARAAMGHTTEQTSKIYTPNHEKRVMNRLKKVEVRFGA